MVRDDSCTLKYIANSRRNSLRVAVVASRKLSKSAVVRNRVRRRIYEQVRGLVPETTPYDLVFTVTDEKVATMSEKQLNAIILKLLQISKLTEGSGSVDNSTNQ